MKTTNNDKLAGIEINLLYAQAELTLAAADPLALIRAVRHIERALKDVRTHKHTARGNLKLVNSEAA